jgi:uncharacterized membrane protein
MDIQRVIRHVLTTQRAVRAAFDVDALAAIEQAIREGEALHGGQVRFVVEASLDGPPLWTDQSPHDRAVDLFAQLRIWDTEHNSGVLIYVLMADRAVEIVADRGIHACCGAQAWAGLCSDMQQQFAQGRFAEGSLSGVRAVGQLLTHHFPRQPQASNELPDRPIVL